MPVKSKAQRRKFADLLVKGKISAATFAAFYVVWVLLSGASLAGAFSAPPSKATDAIAMIRASSVS